MKAPKFPNKNTPKGATVRFGIQYPTYDTEIFELQVVDRKVRHGKVTLILSMGRIIFDSDGPLFVTKNGKWGISDVNLPCNFLIYGRPEQQKPPVTM